MGRFPRTAEEHRRLAHVRCVCRQSPLGRSLRSRARKPGSEQLETRRRRKTFPARYPSIWYLRISVSPVISKVVDWRA